MSDKLTLTPTTQGFYPERLLVYYDSTGQTLINLSDPAAHTAASLTLPSGETYQIVVGSDGGSTQGSYSLAVTQVANVTVNKPALAVTNATVTPTLVQVPAITTSTNSVSNGLGASNLVPLTISAQPLNLLTPPVPQATGTKLENSSEPPREPSRSPIGTTNGAVLFKDRLFQAATSSSQAG